MFTEPELIRAQNGKHAQHFNVEFCTVPTAHLEELSPFLGPNEVCFISQDGKDSAPIDLTAAKQQNALLMHVE